MLLTLAASLMLTPGISRAQFVAAGDFVGEGTWPSISMNVSIRDGWIVLIGRATGQNGGVLWQRRLLPAGDGVTVSHGWMTSFVSVGQRQFVVDNATGQIQELPLGATFRRGYTPPVQPNFPPVPLRPNLPAGPTPGPGVGSEPLVPLESATQPMSIDQPAMRELMRANDALSVALQNMHTLPADASTATITQAQQAVEQARLAVSESRRRLYAKYETSATQPTMPAPPASTPPPPAASGQVTAQHRALQLTQQRLTDLEAESNRVAIALGEAQAASPPDAQRVAELERTLRAVDTRLDQARTDLVEARMAAMFPPLAVLDTDLRCRIGQAERQVIDLTEDVHKAQASVVNMRQAVDRGERTGDDLAMSGTHLLAAIQKLESAKRELADLQQTATLHNAQRPQYEWNGTSLTPNGANGATRPATPAPPIRE